MWPRRCSRSPGVSRDTAAEMGESEGGGVFAPWCDETAAAAVTCQSSGAERDVQIFLAERTETKQDFLCFHTTFLLIRRNKEGGGAKDDKRSFSVTTAEGRNKPPAAAADPSWHPSANGTPRRRERRARRGGRRGRTATDKNNKQSERVTNPGAFWK